MAHLGVPTRAAALAVAVMLFSTCASPSGTDDRSEGPEPAATTLPLRTVELPEPSKAGAVSLEEALQERRSVREFTPEPLTLSDLGQLLWAAQGITSADGGRTAPSAGALYPLEVFVVARQVEGVDAGVWRYESSGEHHLVLVTDGDRTGELRDASLGQEAVGDAPASIVIAGVYARTTGKYAERGERYVVLEAGHAAQNLMLQAVALGLGGVTIGAFDDGDVQRVLELAANEEPFYVIPLGTPAP